MITVYVPDVGDGLAAGIRTIAGHRVQLDCGSQRTPDVALQKGLCRIHPNAFFLSHFHLDHYNGLLQLQHDPHGMRPAIREVFYPRLPEFKQREPFLRCMLALEHWLIGDTSGSMAADFLNVLSQINHGSFTYRSLSKGDTVSIGGSRFDVLWPPKTVEDDATLKVISTAISDFNDAAEKDEALRRILDTIGERGEMKPYLSDEGQTGEMAGRNESKGARGRQVHLDEKRDLPEHIKKANESLRAAANHLSLAFHEDNKFLFLGDLERYEIKQVVSALVAQQRDHFFVVVTPHHGTHWHDDLQHIHAHYSISSVGNGLFRHLSPKFKFISDTHLVTYLNGDVEVPVFFPAWPLPMRRYWNTFL